MLNQCGLSDCAELTSFTTDRHPKLGKVSVSYKGKLYSPTIKRKKYVLSFKIDHHTSEENVILSRSGVVIVDSALRKRRAALRLLSCYSTLRYLDVG